MDNLKLPIALVLAMAAQLAGAVWYVSGIVHDIKSIKENLSKQQELLLVLDKDVDDLWQFCTFTENKWAKEYTSDLVYQRLCGTKEPVE